MAVKTRTQVINRRVQQRVMKTMKTPLHLKSNQAIYKALMPGFKK